MSKQSRSSRREFLSGKSAADALADLTKAPLEEPPTTKESSKQPAEKTVPEVGQSEDEQLELESKEAKPLQPRSMPLGAITLDVSRTAMACTFTVFLNGGEYDQGVESAATALDEIERLEDQLTVYRTHSEMSHVNAQAAESPIAVQGNLFDLLATGKAHWQATEGAFDMTAGPLSKVWGFYRRQGTVPKQEQLSEALALVGSQYVSLDDTAQTVAYERKGVEINLGGIGKGYALDEAAKVFSMECVEHFCFHGGNSSVLARGGQLLGEERLPGWNVGIRHPQRPQLLLGEFWLSDRAMGTSGTATQSFYHQGKRYGHIIDPRTGWPVDGVLSTTVICPSAADADALATAFYVLGLEKTLAYCERRPDVAAILLMSGKKSGSAEVHTANLKDESWHSPPTAWIKHF
jgi:thiamine biosynthesis lipoprotein